MVDYRELGACLRTVGQVTPNQQACWPRQLGSLPARCMPCALHISPKVIKASFGVAINCAGLATTQIESQ